MAWSIFQIYQAEQIRVIFFFLSFLLFFFLSFFFFSSFFMLSTSRHIYDIIEDTEHVRHTECRKKKTYIYIFIYKGERNISPDKKTKRLIGKLYINLASLDISYNLTTQQLLFHFFFFSFSLVINTTLILLQFVIESTVSNIILYIYIYV